MKARNAGLLLVGAAAGALALAALALFDLGSPPGEGPRPSVADATRDQPREVRALTESPREGRSELPYVDPSTAPAPEGELVEVEIVRAGTRAPVPDARVWWWPRPSPFGGEDGMEGWLRRGVVEDRLGEAQGLRSDERGRVWVADAERGFYVAAASGDLWGYASFGPTPDPPARVLLGPDREVRVQVVDSKGSPVLDAVVALRQRRLGSRVDHLTARTRAPDGIAILRHAGHLLGARLEAGEPFLLALQGLFDPPVERALDPRSPAGEIVRLVVEPTGSCEVSVVDESGEPVGGPFEARLRFADAEGGRARFRSGPCVETRHSRGGESVLFEHVALGRPLAVTVTREGSGALGEVRGPGPRAPGERVELRVRVGGNLAVLRGRVLDHAGTPIAAAALRATFEARGTGEPVEAEWLVRSAADGRFSVDTAPLAEVPEGLTLAVHRLSEDGAELAAARRALPAELRAGTHELGDFALAETPVAAEGIVVDGDGNPIARATVTASVPAPRTEEVNEGGRPGRPLAPARSDARGRFALRGEAGVDLIALSAEKAGLAGDPVVVQTGARGVRLFLGAAGAVEGTVLLDPSLLGSMVLAQAVPDPSDPAAEGAREAEAGVVDRGGRFSLGGLRPGRYSVRIVYAANGTELGKVETLSVRAGETTCDPRLDPLDLRANHRLITLELVDERDQPVAHGRAFSRPSDQADARWSFTREVGGRIPLLSDGRPLDVAISAAGFRRAERDRVTSSRRVTLRRAARLRIELAGGLRVPDPPLSLGVELTPLESGRFSGFVESRTATFDAAGVLHLESAFSGDLRLEIFVTRRDQGSSSVAYLEEDVPRVFSVSDHAREQVFEVALDPAKIDAAVRSIREER